MNAFDLVVTVAFGSTLATVLLNKDVTLAEGVLAFALLSALQYVVTFTSVLFPGVQRLVKARPTLLAYRGTLMHDTLRAERVTEEEILAALRATGVGSLAEVEAVVLETDSSFSVVRDGRGQQPVETLSTVEGHPRESEAGRG